MASPTIIQGPIIHIQSDNFASVKEGNADKRSGELLEVPEAKKLHLSPQSSKRDSLGDLAKGKPYVRQDTPTYHDHQQSEIKLDIVKLHSSASTENDRLVARKSPPEDVRRGLKYDGDRQSDDTPRYDDVRKKSRRSLESLSRQRSREETVQPLVQTPAQLKIIRYDAGSLWA